MMKSNIDVVYVFPHIPKTAGLTLKNHFIKHLKHHTEFIHIGPEGIIDDNAKGLIPSGYSLGWEKRCVEDRLRAKVILGHPIRKDIGRLMPNKSIEFITFLRDPVSRWVSTYNFRMHYIEKQPINFFKWYEIHTKGLQSNYHIFHLYHIFLNKSDVRKITSRINRHGFSLKGINNLLQKYMFLQVVNALKQFRYVGLVERFEEDSQKIMQLLGLPQIKEKSNVAGRDYEKRQVVTDEIRQSLTPDCWLDYKLIEIVKEWRKIS